MIVIMEIYSPQHKIYRLGPFTTSEIELQDLFKAWLAISVAFGIVLGGIDKLFSPGFIYIFLFAAVTVGIGFLLHELGHKVVAQRYGCIAEFRAFNMMLLFALAMSFFGIVFAAPGAVMIGGRHIDSRKNGIISAAGPIVNILLALAFIGINALFTLPAQLFNYGFMINSWLALFNMIPFGPLDGAKIARWNLPVYLIMLFTAAAMVFVISGRIGSI